MKYYDRLRDCKAAHPNARWFYFDRKGPGGKTRWYCSRRILKRAAEKLAESGYSPESARWHGFDTVEL